MGHSMMKCHILIYLNSAEVPNWHSICYCVRSTETSQDISESPSAGTWRKKKPPLPGQSFFIEIDDKWIIGCNQNIEAHIEFEI